MSPVLEGGFLTTGLPGKSWGGALLSLSLCMCDLPAKQISLSRPLPRHIQNIYAKSLLYTSESLRAMSFLLFFSLRDFLQETPCYICTMLICAPLHNTNNTQTQF